KNGEKEEGKANLGELLHIVLRSLECGDLSPLCSVATCRDHGYIERIEQQGVKPPWTKAVTGHRTPKVYPKMSRTLSTRPLSSRSLFSTTASCSRSFRCSRVSDVGVTTLTETNISPRPRPPSTGMPLPLMRNTVPVCVPVGILIFSSPSIVGTCTSAPRAACAKVTGCEA